MELPKLMQQMSRRMADQNPMGQWFNSTWGQLPGANAVGPEMPLPAPAQALVGPLETWLHGAESLRHMQLDTIHRTQARAATLARSLGAAHDQAETVAALQNFAQDNFTDAMNYWASYQQIVSETELGTIADANKAAKRAGSAAVKPVRKAVRRRKSTHA